MYLAEGFNGAKITEGFNGAKITRQEIRHAAQKELRRPKEYSRIERFFSLHFELLENHDPRNSHISLLGKSIAAGVQEREKKAVKIINRAARIATDAHKDQSRQLSDDPYILHPYRAAFLAVELAEAMGIPITTELVVGAILHDTIEDHPEMNEEYLYNQFKEFGHNFARRVAGDAEALSKYTGDVKLLPEAYVEKIRSAPTPATLLRRLIIKSSDRVDNLLDPPRSPRQGDETDLLRGKRQKIISKTREDLIPLLQEDTPYMPIRTDHLLKIVDTTMILAQATLDEEQFNPRQWQTYLPHAA